MVPSWPDEELAGAGADVAGLRAGSPWTRGSSSACCSSVRNGAGRLLDELLVAALQRAVAGGDDDDVAVLVGEALGLDVARVVEEALDEALAAAEGGDGLAHGGLEQLGDLLEGAGDLEAAAAAAVGRLDGDRQAVLLGERDDLVGARRPGRRCRAPAARRPSSAMWRALTLSPRASIAVGGRADPGQAGVDDRLGEVGVLGEEAVAGVHGVGAGLARRRRGACRCTR